MDFEHPTLQGALPIVIIPRALPWAKSFCPFRACCFYELLGLQPVHKPLAKLELKYYKTFASVIVISF